MKLYKDSDANLEALAGKTVAVLGYGNQGQAQALNLRDSGVDVIVGNRDDLYRERAIADGFAPVSILEAATAGDILLVLTTDESQPLIWAEQILPGLRPGKMLSWSSGYNVGFGLINPPRRRGRGHDRAAHDRHPWCASCMSRGRARWRRSPSTRMPAASAWETMLALCKGMGLTRGGVFESSFREEAELDLFAEQVVWAGLEAWFVECFEIGVEAGFSPELMVMELYASGETAEIFTQDDAATASSAR